MPRPTKKDTDKLTVLLPIRLSPDDRKKYKNLASSKGLSVSDYIRGLVERDASFKPAHIMQVVNDNAPPYVIDEQLLHQLYRIGNNLNQLTKKFHSEGQEPPGLRSLFPVLEKLLTHIFKRINVE